MKAPSFFIFLFFFVSAGLAGQENIVDFGKHKGDFYFYWGYNRAFYNTSTIHFEGNGYDFTLYDVYATDRPAKFDPKVYFNPKKISSPQFNFRMGYFLSDNWSLSLGSDHMKYVVIQNQHVMISGHIDEGLSSNYGGDYHKNYVFLRPEFLRYEHTNGFNFVRIGLENRSKIWQSTDAHHQMVVMPGINAGLVLPWTNYTFLNTRHSDLFHWGGYGFSFTTAFRYEYKNTWFFQIQGQYGFSHLSRVLLEDRSGEFVARQNIVFFERSFALGAYLHSFNQQRKKL